MSGASSYEREQWCRVLAFGNQFVASKKVRTAVSSNLHTIMFSFQLNILLFLSLLLLLLLLPDGVTHTTCSLILKDNIEKKKRKGKNNGQEKQEINQG